MSQAQAFHFSLASLTLFFPSSHPNECEVMPHCDVALCLSDN
jgi:hypothetical protein